VQHGVGVAGVVHTVKFALLIQVIFIAGDITREYLVVGQDTVLHIPDGVTYCQQFLLSRCGATVYLSGYGFQQLGIQPHIHNISAAPVVAEVDSGATLIQGEFFRLGAGILSCIRTANLNNDEYQ